MRPVFLQMELDMEEITEECHACASAAGCYKENFDYPRNGIILSMCFADRDMVNLVLRNLLSNAIKFTPQKGKIIICLKTESSFCRISINDNGIGMDTGSIEKNSGK